MEFVHRTAGGVFPCRLSVVFCALTCGMDMDVVGTLFMIHVLSPFVISNTSDRAYGGRRLSILEPGASRFGRWVGQHHGWRHHS